MARTASKQRSHDVSNLPGVHWESNEQRTTRYAMILCHFLAKHQAKAESAGGLNKENDATAKSFLNLNRKSVTASASAHHEPEITTLFVDGFDETIEERHVNHLFRPFGPIVSVSRPKDKHGKPCSHAFVTLLPQKADNAIKFLNGRRVEDWTWLQVQKSVKSDRKVPIAVIKNGRRVCRAFRNGSCLEKCPFGLEHASYEYED